MGLSINTNVASLNAQRQIQKTQFSLNSSFQRLSSGLRVNSAADDAAGLAISERLKAQVRSLAQAERNAMDGISLIQTAEGGYNEIAGILTRMRELAVQSANGTLNTTDRSFINVEYQQLRSEVDRIAQVTEFNGVNLTNGSTGGVTAQVGIDNSSNDRIVLNLTTATAAALGNSTTSLDGIAMTTVASASLAIGVIDDAINDISGARATLGAAQNRLQTTVTNLASARENLSAANSRIRDVDVAHETAQLTRNSILMQAGTSILAQANQLPSLALSLL